MTERLERMSVSRSPHIFLPEDDDKIDSMDKWEELKP